MGRKRQRYLCHVCKSSFSKTPKYTYSKKLIDSLVSQYVSGKSSYRDLARDNGVDKKIINAWVNSYATKSKTTIETAQELQPQWTGYLTADGKVIKYRGKKGCLYIGVDNCGDIVHILFTDSPENKTYWCRFFNELNIEIHYRLIALISDGNEAILGACSLYFHGFSYQTCLHHFLKRIDRTFGYLTAKRHRDRRIRFKLEIEFRNDIKRLLHQNTLTEFIVAYRNLINKFTTGHNTDDCYKMMRLVCDNLFQIVTHYADSNIPATNNMAETTIKQYERRLKTMEGFQSTNSSNSFLNLFTFFLRCKLYTDCKKQNRYKNGRSRLQLAEVNIDADKWLFYSQN